MPYLFISLPFIFWTIILPRWTTPSQKNDQNNHVVARQQTTPERSGTFRNVLVGNSPEPSGTCLRNLHHAHTGALPPESTPAQTAFLRNPKLPPEPTPQHPPEPSKTFRFPEHGTYLRNLYQHTPELSRTFRNLPLKIT